MNTKACPQAWHRCQGHRRRDIVLQRRGGSNPRPQPTARLVWELCDGQHTVEDVERAIKLSFSVDDEHDVIGDIHQTLEILAAKGLLAR